MPTLSLHGQDYKYDLNDVEIDTAEQVESLWGDTYGDWLAGLSGRSMRALRILVWLCRTQAGESVRITDVKFKLSDVAITADAEAADPTEAAESETDADAAENSPS